LVAHRVWVAGAAGSNPASPTRRLTMLAAGGGFAVARDFSRGDDPPEPPGVRLAFGFASPPGAWLLAFGFASPLSCLPSALARPSAACLRLWFTLGLFAGLAFAWASLRLGSPSAWPMAAWAGLSRAHLSGRSAHNPPTGRSALLPAACGGLAVAGSLTSARPGCTTPAAFGVLGWGPLSGLSGWVGFVLGLAVGLGEAAAA
jgi:hypothetical protein